MQSTVKDIFDSREYKISRAGYTVNCGLEYLISIPLADAFLAKLLKAIGLTDATVGIISSLVSFAFLFYLASIPLMKVMKNTKKTVILFDTLGMLFEIATYAIPFLPVSQTVKTVLVYVCLGCGYFFGYFIGSILWRWCNSFVHPNKRGDFTAFKEITSLVAGSVYTLVLGWIVDKFEAAGNLSAAFILIGIIMLVMEAGNFVSLLLVAPEKAENGEDASHGHSFREALRHTLGNKNFLRVVAMQILFNASLYTVSGFMGTYKTQELGFPVLLIEVFAVGGALARIFLSKPIGRFSDKTSYVRGYELGLIIMGASFLTAVFTTPGTRWLIAVYAVLFSASYAGVWGNATNMLYAYVDPEYFVEAMAFKQCTVGLTGFGMSLLASKLLSQIQADGNMFLGMHVYAQQVLAAIALVGIIVTFLFAHFVVGKQDFVRR